MDVAKYWQRGHKVGEASHPGRPKSLFREARPFAIGGLRNVVPKERTQTFTAVDSDEEPLLPQEHEPTTRRHIGGGRD